MIGFFIKNKSAGGLLRGCLVTFFAKKLFSKIVFFDTKNSRNFFHDDVGNKSVFACLKGANLRFIYIDANLVFFENSFAKHFIHQLMNGLKENGVVALPVSSDASRGWTEDWLERLLGQPIGKVNRFAVTRSIFSALGTKSSYFLYKKTDTILEKTSGLGWFYANADDVGRKDRAFLRKEYSYSELLTSCEDFLISAPEDEPGRAGDDPKADDFGNTLNHLQTMNYSISGANFKSEIIRHILSEFKLDTKSLTYMDQGGGFGLNLVELLLNNSNIQRGVLCDISSRHLMLANEVFRWFQGELKNRFYMQVQDAVKYRFSEKFDVVSLIGFMLYLPRPELPNVLGRAWEAINPGGILIWHENIKRRHYTRDFAKMFEPSELDGLLEPFGTVRFFSSMAKAEIPAPEVYDQTVFRVVQKTG